MNERRFSIPELVLFGATRVALGMGIGFLVSRAMNNDERKAAGIALTVVGGATTIPLVIGMVRRMKGSEPKMMPSAAA
ncbi:MAG TPA: hypothetical protein VMB66_07145 [Candidatus Acidoferrales bacterium]|jgi:hypothetical protein|nr:hypothetical protein [Candidatus Acidoferrales bacterium]